MASHHEEEVLGKAYDARLMRRLLGYLRPYKASVAVALVAIIAGSVLQLGQPYLTKLAIDRYIATGDLAGLNWIALAFLAILLASFGLEYLQMWTLQMTGQRIMFDMRMQIYAHLQRLDLAFYDRNPVGRLMTRVTTDVDVINDLFTSGVVAAFGDLFMLVGIMVTLLWMDWRLAAITFSVLPLIVLVTQATNPGRQPDVELPRTSDRIRTAGGQIMLEFDVELTEADRRVFQNIIDLMYERFVGVVARVESLRGRMSEAGRQVEGLFESLLAEGFG